MGAICHDCGPEYVEKMLDITIYKHVEDVNYDEITDFKTKLQELIQADQRKTVTYDLISSSGPSNNPGIRGWSRFFEEKSRATGS